MNKTQMSELSVEEAFRYLKSTGMSSEQIADVVEALSDAISRQAVLEAIEDDNKNAHYSCFASNNDAQCFKQVIQELPSVTPAEKVGRWIPVSEGLPEEHKEVLTCSLGGFIEIQSIEHDYWENQHGDWVDVDEVEVVAWMPLPEPYKASPTGAEGGEK